MSGVNVSCCCTAWRYQQALENLFADLGSLCNHCHQMPSRHPCLDFSMLSFKQQKTNRQKEHCGTKILGTQLFRTTQMCQGSTCHVFAQHGDISKLKKALLLTWEVCATIASRYHEDIHVWISQC